MKLNIYKWQKKTHKIVYMEEEIQFDRNHILNSSKRRKNNKLSKIESLLIVMLE